MREQDLVILLTFSLLTYLSASIAAAIHLTDKASTRWPRRRHDGGFILLGLFSVIVLGALWPLTYPAIWIVRSFVADADSDASCFGFNYSRWQGKRKARKAQRAQDVELERMERAAQRLEEQQPSGVREADEEVERHEAAKARVAVKRAALLGAGTGAGDGAGTGAERRFQFDQEEEELTSTGHLHECPRAGRARRGAGIGACSTSDGEVDIEAQAGRHMSNAAVSDARGERSINGPPHNEGYAVVPRPVVVPPYLPRSTNTSSQTGGGSSPKPPPYSEITSDRYP